MSMEAQKPTKEFFESDPVAADIRSLTLDGVAGCLHRIMGREGQDERILDAAARLQALGVTAGMHLIQSDDPRVVAREQQALLSSPRKAAEFVGGTFLSYLYDYDGAIGSPVSTATPEEREEFARILAEGDIPHEFKMTMADMASLSLMERMLDRRPEEFREP